MHIRFCTTSCLVVTTFFLASLLSGCESTSETTDHPSGDQIRLAWGVVEHTDSGFESELIIANEGSAAIPAEDWSLYFNTWVSVRPETVAGPVAIEHLNGDLYRLRPAGEFEPIPPGDSLRITYLSSGSAVNASYGPDGFYFVWDEDGSAVIDDAGDPDVLPYTRDEQTRRSAGDLVPLATPQHVFGENQSLQLTSEVPPIIPRPQSIDYGDGTLTIDRSFAILYDGDLQSEAEFLADALRDVYGARPDISADGPPSEGAIHLSIDPALGGDEAYRLTVDSGIRIVGSGAAGVFYGIQSLRALFPVAVFGLPAASFELPRVDVADAPRFPYRGMHLDVARNFHPTDDVKPLLDLMSFYKLNKFHFHLSDDEGWRLEIEGLPELTSVGGRRGHTLTEEEHLQPALGSGPFPDASRGSGSYTRAEFIDLLRYAHLRHIEVIPEIDTPGHARAAIIAMRTRARRQQNEEYLLTHPDDESEYISIQNYRGNVMDVCLPSTYHFLETLTADIVEMYEEAGVPLKTIHTGGDEVPHGVWEGSPACRELIAADPDVDGIEDLHDYFVRRFDNILNRYGLITAGWEEIALTAAERNGRTVHVPNPAFVDDAIQANVWNAVWGWGSEGTAYALANAGYDIVISNASNYYLDMPYAKHPDEPGLYWAGFIGTRDPFSFIPFDLYKSAERDLMGRPIDPQAYAGYERLTDEGRDHVLGLQGQLWSENIRNTELLHYMIFPRIISLAERAWAAQPEWAVMETREARRAALAEDWNVFANALGRRELPRLDHLQIRYRIPPPGGVIEGGILRANVALPGMTIRYTTDGTEPIPTSAEYTQPVAVAGTAKLRTFSSTGRGSRTVTVQP